MQPLVSQFSMIHCDGGAEISPKSVIGNRVNSSEGVAVARMPIQLPMDRGRLLVLVLPRPGWVVGFSLASREVGV